ncbi:MAG TPA: radical SAM protein [Acidobacteriota bacterium]
MRIALVYTRGFLKEMEHTWPPLGLGYLSSYAKKYGDYQDVRVFSDDDLAELIEYRPQLVGVSATTPYYHAACEATKKIKAEIPCLAVVGGHQITHIPKSLHPAFDAGVMQEGEQTFLELADCVKATGRLDPADLAKIQGVCYRDGGAVASTPDRPLIKELDIIPFPDREAYNFRGPIGHLLSARGCPYRCVFCSSTFFWNRIRYFSPAYVVEEIREMVGKYGYEEISFQDDLFALNKRRIREIAERIVAEDLHKVVRFTCNAKVNTVSDDIFEELRRMNVVAINFGIESAAPHILEYLKAESATVEQLEHAFAMAKRHGLRVGGPFIIGSPNETAEDVRTSIRFFESQPIDDSQVYVLTPLPGTKVWEEAEAKGIVNENMDWSTISGVVDFEDIESYYDNHLILADKMTRSELVGVYKEFKYAIKRKKMNSRFDLHPSPDGKLKVALIALYDHNAFGVRYMASHLMRAGHDVQAIFLKDPVMPENFAEQFRLNPAPLRYEPLTLEEENQLRIKLAQLKPDVVGISLRSSLFHIAVQVTHIARELGKIPIVWGGTHPILDPESCLPYADIVCIGEGEEWFTRLIDRLGKGEDILELDNFYFNTYGPGQPGVIKRPVGMTAKDLDDLPFPLYKDFERMHYINVRNVDETVYDMLGARGCPFRCTFCSESAFVEIFKGKGKQVRQRTVDNLIAEIKDAMEANPKINRVFFHDEVFAFKHDWVLEFASKWKAEIGMPFGIYTHPKYTAKELMKELREAGLNFVILGVQSGSEKSLKDMYGRTTARQDIIDGARELEELDIPIRSYDIIVDNPVETEADYKATLSLLLKLKRPFEINFASLTYFPNTKLTDMALEMGIIKDKHIEGANSQKALDQWVMSFDYPRSKQEMFYILLMAMTMHEFIPKSWIRTFAKIRPLQWYPKALYWFFSTLYNRHKRSFIQGIKEHRQALEAQKAERAKQGMRAAA